MPIGIITQVNMAVQGESSLVFESNELGDRLMFKANEAVAKHLAALENKLMADHKYSGERVARNLSLTYRVLSVNVDGPFKSTEPTKHRAIYVVWGEGNVSHRSGEIDYR